MSSGPGLGLGLSLGLPCFLFSTRSRLSTMSTACTDSATHSSHTSTQRNRWSRMLEHIKEPAAEFLGVMILVLFGSGAACQAQLSGNKNVASTAYGDALSTNFGFAVGLGLGGWVAGLTSKGHINPAVTIAMATFRPKDFPWRKVPAYIVGQVLGGLCGAGIVYANYIHAIDLVEGGRHVRTVPGTASLFGTYALPYMTAASAWFEEFLGTALLLIAVCAMSDVKNPSSTVLAPLVLFVTMLGISSAFGMQTGFAINPARDLGPRLLTAMVGYGAPVFTFRNQYWLWCPIIAPIAGALVGTFFYDLLFYNGNASILRKQYVCRRRLSSFESIMPLLTSHYALLSLSSDSDNDKQAPNKLDEQTARRSSGSELKIAEAGCETLSV
ncbi:transporter [Ganoderma sinense ZZ0214-1]|uniref:Transporter n=1 Tax=Ganoderma sinense ZZ0214-1 TaxID=1077348 RepID=A0A2G8S995_9APHY|nr:transporter [Ganoderma sinense ZZ0214-1]